MIWNVYRENVNTKRIETYNIFEHASFRKDVEEAYATCRTKDEFVEQLYLLGKASHRIVHRQGPSLHGLYTLKCSSGHPWWSSG